MVSGGWNWGIDTPSSRHSSSSSAGWIRIWPSIFVFHPCHPRVANVGTRSSETRRTKQEHYFNLLLLLISTSAIIQEAELCVSQLSPYEQSITVSASLRSALALSFFLPTCFSLLCFSWKTLLAEGNAMHRIPQLTVQTCFQIRQHLHHCNNPHVTTREQGCCPV